MKLSKQATEHLIKENTESLRFWLNELHDTEGFIDIPSDARKKIKDMVNSKIEIHNEINIYLNQLEEK
jgi:hypothetical protein